MLICSKVCTVCVALWGLSQMLQHGHGQLSNAGPPAGASWEQLSTWCQAATCSGSAVLVVSDVLRLCFKFASWEGQANVGLTCLSPGLTNRTCLDVTATSSVTWSFDVKPASSGPVTMRDERLQKSGLQRHCCRSLDQFLSDSVCRTFTAGI